MSTPAENAAAIKALAAELGFMDCRIARAKEATHADHFRKWLANGENGTMDWFHRSAERRTDPRKVVEGCLSLVMLAFNYYPGEPPLKTNFRIARYAWNKDYHDVILPKLKVLHELMLSMGGKQRYYVDTGHVLEKDFANDAGLGWNGKQTVQIHAKFGNYFVLSDLLTTLELPPDEASNDHCGKCTLCIDYCPTGAIVAPHHVDARRCISYLTIENRGPIPEEFRKAIGDRIYGCDVCLEVCPWNRFAQMSHEASFHARESIFELSARDFLSMEQADFSRIFTKSPIKRAKLRGMKRNACVVLGNVGTAEDLPELQKLAGGDDEMLAEHATWAIREIEVRLAEKESIIDDFEISSTS